MTLDTTADNLMAEINAAVKHRKQQFSGWKDLVARFKGPDMRLPANKRSQENVEFRHLSRRVPQQAFTLPRVRCDSPRMDMVDDVANLERGLARWMHSSNFEQVAEQTAYDFNLKEAVVVVYRRECEEMGEINFPIPGSEEKRKAVPYWPSMVRLSPDEAFKDPRGSNPYDYRFAGRVVVEDYDDMVARGGKRGWRTGALKAMVKDANLDKAGRRPMRDGPTRNEVTYYEVWVADAPIDWETEGLNDEGEPVPEEKRYHYNGKIFYLATTYQSNGKAQSAWIRDPQPYLGPATGPYVFFGEHLVPGEPEFESTLGPNAGTIEILNQATEAINAGIRSRKSLTLVNDVSEGLEDKIANAPNLTVHVVPGLESTHVVNSESGGITTQQLEGRELLQQRLDRNMGEDDTARGKADASASATSVALAARNAGALDDYAQAQFHKGWRRILNIVAYLIWHDEEFAIEIGLDEAVALGDPVSMYAELRDGQMVMVRQPMIYGGTDKKHSFASLQVTTEAYSSERMSPEVAAMRGEMLMALTERLSALYMTNPAVRGAVLQPALARYFRVPELESVIDFGALAELMESRVHAEAAATMAAEKPQLSGDQASPSKPKVAGATTKGAQGPRTGPAGGGGGAKGPTRLVKPGGMEGRAQGGKAGEQARQTAKAGAA